MIVITAPTGQIGSRLLDLLLDGTGPHREELRVIVRDPGKLPEAVRARVDVVTGSHGDAQVVDRAFAGADAVFWLVPPNRRAPSLAAVYSEFTRAAAKAFTAHGVGHVVGVSALGRGTPAADRAGHVTASLAMDDLIARTGVAYRALANPSFMDNLLGQAASIRDDGVFTDLVAADRKAPVAATRDIAAAAAGLLLDRSWTGTGEVPVLGPEDLSPNDLAAVMSEVLGRPVRYERQTPDAFRSALAAQGTTDTVVQGYLDMMRAKDDGLDSGVRRTSLTASPTTFREWCEQVLRPAVARQPSAG
ncbi:NAD(P)H-binding protein [Kitasatospora sp. NPDC048194]|uniref:NAD(P)H-binding protein n=1 Tax=Kitasatospora sp. NPDC048194 TaxID=3364045 RepID=UPI00371D6C39